MPNTKINIAFITQAAPYGIGEAFVIEEIRGFCRLTGVLIIPMRPGRSCAHSDAGEILGNTRVGPLVGLSNLGASLAAIIAHPLRVCRAVRPLLASRSLWIMGKNAVIIPKAIWIAAIARHHGIKHIHAYWASTSATAAMIAAELAQITWSFTCYRWDIAENNLLKIKVDQAAFTRVADEHGRREIAETVGPLLSEKVVVVRSGVAVPARPAQTQDRVSIRIGVPALLVEKKGHSILLAALEIVSAQAIEFKCMFFGDGPMRQAIEQDIDRRNLAGKVEMWGLVDHARLMEMYQRGDIDIVVLPSIVTASNEREGIPISLIEAMSAGIPVISTDTGGIGELVDSEVGILVEQKNTEALADAIIKLALDRKLRLKKGRNARMRVVDNYEVDAVVRNIVERIR